MEKYQPIIGLEIHVELSTKSKMFCQCNADWFGKEPNTHTCPVCLGMPGALPVPNKQAVEWTIKMAQALGCKINKHSKFDRKNYFYPDIPKGYQISQYDEPIGEHGAVEILHKEELKKFRIRRVHLEEDTGKLSHVGEDTLIDFNRSSVPLVEIVTEADFNNSEDVKAFLEELHTIIRYLGVSDADMEKGSMRIEPNISVKLKTQEGFPPYKVEVKNINSFNFVKKTIDFEIKRHIELLEEGKTPIQETRGYDDVKGVTYSQRTKENAQDYRYFPEPDIPPMEFDNEYLEKIQSEIPELPLEKMNRYINDFKIKSADAYILTRNKQIAAYFEEVIESANAQIEAQKLANAIINKRVSTDLMPANFVQEVIALNQTKTTDAGLLAETIEKVIAANEKSVSDYKSGKVNALMFLVGQVMKEMKGQADAQTVKAELEKKLN